MVRCGVLYFISRALLQRLIYQRDTKIILRMVLQIKLSDLETKYV